MLNPCILCFSSAIQLIKESSWPDLWVVVPEVAKDVVMAEARLEKAVMPKLWNKSNLGVIVFVVVFVASIVVLLADNAMGR